jgi:hypothetical protein
MRDGTSHAVAASLKELVEISTKMWTDDRGETCTRLCYDMK